MFQDDNALRCFNGLKSLGSFHTKKANKVVYFGKGLGQKNPIWVNKALVK